MTRLNTPKSSTSKAAAALTTAMLVVALSGCTNELPDAAPSTDTGSGTTQAARTLNVGVPAPATGINPASVNTAFADFAGLAYEPLLRVAPDGTYVGALAEEWSVADGNMSADITLREGVTFADGTPVTADAVKASLDYCASDASTNKQSLQDLEAVTVTGENQLTITLTQPNPLFEYMLTERQGCGMIISPAGLDDIDNLTVDTPSAGAGPYIYDPTRSIPGDTYTYTANPAYWNLEKQHVDTIVLKVFAQPQAALNALTTGQIDMATGDLTTAKQASDAGLQLAWTPFIWSGLNLIDRNGETTPGLGDLKVRQAINFAIDREAIATALLGEFGVPATQPSAEGFDGWSQEAVDYYSYDLEKAKQLMAESGFPDGFELPVMTVAFGGLDIITTAVKPMLAEIGITIVELVSTDEKTYVDGMYSREYSAVAVGYGSQPMYLMGSALVLPTALPFNGFGTDDPAANEILDRIRVSGGEEQAAAARELNMYLVENAWFAPVAFGPVLYYSQDNIGGLEVSGKRPTVSVREVYFTD